MSRPPASACLISVDADYAATPFKNGSSPAGAGILLTAFIIAARQARIDFFSHVTAAGAGAGMTIDAHAFDASL